MDKSTLESALGSALTAAGFRKKSSTWYRPSEGGLQLVNLQKSAYGQKHYLNLACVPAGMTVEGMPTPKEYSCPIRIRLEAAYESRRESIQRILNLENASLDDEQREQAAARLVEELILPFFALLTDAGTIRDAIKNGLLKNSAITLSAQKHLGLNQ